MSVRILLAAVSLSAVASVSAQQSAPAPASNARPAMATHGCKKPGDHPGRLASDTQRRNWVKDANDYLACLKKFALDQQAIAQPLFEQAKPYADAANAAIEEHNKAAGEFKVEQEKNN